MSHVAAFPRYRDRASPIRRLATYSGGELVGEDGSVAHLCDWAALRERILADNLLALGPNLQHSPRLLASMLSDAGTEVLLNQDERPALVCVREGRKRGYMVPYSAWFDGEVPDPAMLPALATLFRHCETGARLTPSALGVALLRQSYPEHGGLLSRPSTWLWHHLHDTMVGGRADTWAAGIEFPRAWGEDMTGAYVAASRRIPGGGGAVGFSGLPPSWAATYYVNATVTMPPWPLGPLPVRDGQRRLYPVGETFRGHWWAEELRLMPASHIEYGQGYAWRALDDCLEAWAARVWELRESAPDALVAALVKRCSVAALGRLQVPWLRLRLAPWQGEGEVWSGPDLLNAPPARVLREVREDELMPIHAASYIHMCVRCALYRRAYPYAEEYSLIATNFDEVLTCRQPVAEERPRELGEWKLTEYTNLTVPFPRGKRADGVSILPGIPKRTRSA